MSVMIVTSSGELVVDLFTDRCPLTCKNFLKLCKIKYYNGCLFHTIQKDFTAQTGDPTGTGSGGDSVYKFLYGEQARFFGDEIHLDVKHSKIGTLAMASAGENLNASQFYITLREDIDYLDGKHTVFGEVAEGLETLTRINEAIVNENNRPLKNIRIKHTYIIDDPFEDPPLLAELIPGASPEGKPKDEIMLKHMNIVINDLKDDHSCTPFFTFRKLLSYTDENQVADDTTLEDDWIPLDEKLDPQEIQEVLHEKAAKSSAVVLETLGDIPHAEVAPPENVLFVCKLNPVTEDEDLHTIFSRFGDVTSAEVIRDHKTGYSLCYAFIEFEDVNACQEAYFKMNNALIDDRRIRVDFSQSVSKMFAEYKNGGKPRGGGCFKCGSFDHIAKDCGGEGPASEQPRSKYMLKDDNTQRGGDRSTRYEMVFDEDDGEPRRSEKRRDQKSEKHEEKQNNKQRETYKPKYEDERRRETHDSHRRHERSKGREDQGSARHQGSPHGRGTKDYSDRDGRDERDHRRRNGSGGDASKYEKKLPDDVGHEDKKHENEIKKRSQNEDVRGSHRDRHDSGDDKYGHKRSRGEERHSDKRSSKGDDYRERNRGRDESDRRRRNDSGDDASKYDKKLLDDVGHGDEKNENEVKRRSRDEEDVRSHRDRHVSGDDNHGHKRSRGEERHSDKRSYKGDDHRDRNRGRRH